MTAGHAFAFRTILFLAGLILLLVILIQGIRRGSTRRMLASSIGLGLVILAVTMGNWKIYQCKFTVPDQIDVYGHVKGDSNSYLNGYMVLLYEGNVETANNITHRGSFTRNKKDKEDDGYFEFEIPNTELTRCSLTGDFKQASFGRNYLWSRNKITYLAHDFNGLGPGANFRITLDEQKKKYTLIVLQRSAGDYPNEINIYHTYLDPTGSPAINIPIKTYIMYGDSAAETETGYYVEAHPLSTAASGALFPAMMEVRDAWVEDDKSNPITPKIDPRAVGEEIIDIDNCTGSASIDKTETRSRVYIHEVQFEGTPSYDLGQVAIKAAPSLGFAQGKIDIANATISMQVPAWTHMKYKIVWHDSWKPGKMRIDSGASNNSLTIRERIGLWWELVTYSVDCP
jgi:hypothetical protein